MQQFASSHDELNPLTLASSMHHEENKNRKKTRLNPKEIWWSTVKHDSHASVAQTQAENSLAACVARVALTPSSQCPQNESRSAAVCSVQSREHARWHTFAEVWLGGKSHGLLDCCKTPFGKIGNRFSISLYDRLRQTTRSGVLAVHDFLGHHLLAITEFLLSEFQT